MRKSGFSAISARVGIDDGEAAGVALCVAVDAIDKSASPTRVNFFFDILREGVMVSVVGVAELIYPNRREKPDWPLHRWHSTLYSSILCAVQ